MGFPSRLLSVAFDSLDQIPECGQGRFHHKIHTQTIPHLNIVGRTQLDLCCIHTFGWLPFLHWCRGFLFSFTGASASFTGAKVWFASLLVRFHPPLPTLSPLSPPTPPKILAYFLKPPADSTGLGSIVKSIRKPYPVGTFFVQVKIHGFFQLL